MERQVAVVAGARDHPGHVLIQGRSCVLFDSAAPNVNPGAISRSTCMTDMRRFPHHPPNRPDFVRHLATPPLVGCES